MIDIIRRYRAGHYYTYVGAVDGKRVSVDVLASYVDEFENQQDHDAYIKRSLKTVADLPENYGGEAS